MSNHKFSNTHIKNTKRGKAYIASFCIKLKNFSQTKNMERTVKETYDALYSSSLESLEKNLDRLIEAKHNDLKTRLENQQKSNLENF
jgi:hypothetical protein